MHFRLTLCLISFFCYAPLRAGEIASWSSVGSGPRALWDEENFQAYWGIWVDIEPSPASSPTQVIYSQRRSSFETFECATGTQVSSGEELFSFADLLEFDEQGQVRPIAEAPLKGKRYFSLFNVNGLYLRSQEPHEILRKVPGEARKEADRRIQAHVREWKARHTPQGHRGVLRVEWSLSKPMPHDPVRLASYREFREWKGPERNAPDRWPFYYDERAHKPFRQGAWDSDTPLARHARVELHWDWCVHEGKATPNLRVEEYFSHALDSGAERPGRSSHLYSKIPRQPSSKSVSSEQGAVDIETTPSERRRHK